MESVTEVSFNIASNTKTGEVDYSRKYSDSFIVLDVIECHNAEGSELYGRDVAFQILPKYQNYALVSGTSRIIAIRQDSSTAPIKIKLKVHEIIVATDTTT